MGLRFSRIVLYLDFFWDEQDYSSSLAYTKHAMLRSKVLAGYQIMTKVRPKKSVEFTWQTIDQPGLCYCHSSSFANPSQEFFSSSLSAVTLSGVKKASF